MQLARSLFKYYAPALRSRSRGNGGHNFQSRHRNARDTQVLQALTYMNLEPTAHRWAELLAGTPLSLWLQEHLWVVPTSQSLHIVALSVVYASALIISLRLLGLGKKGRPVAMLMSTLTPWMYGALVILLLTGAVQTITEPLRQFVTPAFWWKMCMIVVIVVYTVIFDRSVRRHSERWSAANANPLSARLFALTSLALWTAIVVCGRLIGYTWEQHV
jgi:hypothetical protein